MQLRRAAEICNNNENNNITLYYYNKPVKLVSVDNNIGTAYVKSLMMIRNLKLI
ncbi:small, acid-soluble spore protein, H family [Paraclostridium sp. AKS46]|nr:small, acid-soluble spore protein, H family [Paraclostridium sp. AKS46]